MFLFRKKQNTNYDHLESVIEKMHPVQHVTILVMSNAIFSVLSTFFRLPLSIKPYEYPEESKKALESINESIENAKKVMAKKSYPIVDLKFTQCHIVALELVALTLMSINDKKNYVRTRKIWHTLWKNNKYIPKAISWFHYYENKTDSYPIPYANTAGKKPWTDVDYMAMSKTVPSYIKNEYNFS